MRKEKPPVPKYHYKLVTVSDSYAANSMEKALREKFAGQFAVSLFSICHGSGSYDVMGDSGLSPLTEASLKDVRALAAQIHKAC